MCETCDPQTKDLAEAALVVVAYPGDEARTRAAVSLARAARSLVYAVDFPSLSDIAFPARLRRGDIEIGLSTKGAAPALARLLRGRLEAALPERLDALVRFAAAARPVVKERVATFAARRALWDEVFRGVVAERILSGDETGAHRRFERLLDQAEHGILSAPTGVVYRLSAGPGAPDLLTLRAQRVLLGADLVVYDRSVPPEIVALARREALKVPVVSHGSPRAGLSSAEVVGRVVEAARAGLTVVRITVGAADTGPEIAALKAADLAVEIVPGVSPRERQEGLARRGSGRPAVLIRRRTGAVSVRTRVRGGR
ncbi:SAM-dependent methyltransferase [Pararhodospirillum photometricum]|uniref:precorrin-2 dehydrogenase n=1 Tax=Pararhodospirillum photometricum DSM 122 TaxID=1150469 RepID=H6SQJ8_PARPM|nr:SAM-dependent methyltransferase [Pararhodospirillum photometricum]CCG07313.1 Siroheme synthase [Pararhodospirillum photometricum DSM 122]